MNPQNLGLILQRATGKRYADYLSESLWQHIGATDAYVVLDSEEHRVAHFFCCLNATARSWLQVGMLHLTSGLYDGEQVVPAGWMRDIVTPSPRNPNYGYFTWLGNEYQEHRHYNRKTGTNVYHSEPFAAKDMIYFDGFGGQRVYAVLARPGDRADRLARDRLGRCLPSESDHPRHQETVSRSVENESAALRRPIVASEQRRQLRRRRQKPARPMPVANSQAVAGSGTALTWASLKVTFCAPPTRSRNPP